MLGNLNLFNRIKQEKLEKADEQVLLSKIVEEYLKENKIEKLYELLTRGNSKITPSNIKYGIEAQPLTHREKEGNTYLDLAMGSIKRKRKYRIRNRIRYY